MSREARLFYESWAARTFATDAPWTDMFPTPLAAWTELRAEAVLAGLREADLRAALGDPIGALTAAMLEAPPPDPVQFRTAQDSGHAQTPTAAMELALSYAEGLHDAVGSDRTLSAVLVLHYLARQGFALRAFKDGPPRDAASSLAAPSDQPR